MGETAALVREDAVVRVPGGILRDTDAERPAQFHAFEDEVDAVSVGLLHAAQCGQHVFLFAHSLFGPLDGNSMVAGKGFYPVLVIVGALDENLFIHHRQAEDLTEEVDHLFGPGQPVQVAVDDDAVEAVVYQSKQIAEEPGEQFHRNFTLRKGGQRWGGQRSDAGLARGICVARISGWPSKSVTSSAAPPHPTGASSQSAHSRCFPPIPAMPGSWTPPITSPPVWHEVAIPSRSSLRKRIPTSPSGGRATTASTAMPSSSLTTTRLASSPSVAIRPTVSLSWDDSKITNTLGQSYALGKGWIVRGYFAPGADTLMCFSNIFRRTTAPYTLPAASTPTPSAPLCSSVVDSMSSMNDFTEPSLALPILMPF